MLIFQNLSKYFSYALLYCVICLVNIPEYSFEQNLLLEKIFLRPPLYTFLIFLVVCVLLCVITCAASVWILNPLLETKQPAPKLTISKRSALKRLAYTIFTSFKELFPPTFQVNFLANRESTVYFSNDFLSFAFSKQF